MAVSFDQYLERLAQCGLLTTSEVQSHVAALPDSARPKSADELARWLVRQGLLTAFQASAVYQGKTKGLVLGNYVILHRLGTGGMGQVFKARHRRMKRIVAIKILPASIARRPELIQRFSREMEAAARLMHPNIVAAFDADEADGLHFLVMEYVPGRDLGTLVKERGPLSVNLALRCLLDAARALDYAHKNGIVHRDIKPSNLLMTRADPNPAAGGTAVAEYTVKLLDLGLARIDEESADAGDPGLTDTGLVMGTVDYMSPEQAINTHTVDHRTDIYSLGMTLYFLLTGRSAYPGKSAMERFLAHRENPIPSLVEARSDVPLKLDTIFRRMVAKQPEDRYQSVGELIGALDGVLEGSEVAVDLPLEEPTPPDDAALAEFLRSMSSTPRVGGSLNPSEATQLQLEPPGLLRELETSHALMTGSGGSTAETPLTAARLRFPRNPGTIKPWLLHAGWIAGLLLLGIIWAVTSRPSPNGTVPRQGVMASAVSLPEASTVPTSPSSPPDAEIALWVLRNGGNVVVVDGGGRVKQLHPGDPLPQWSCFITRIHLAGQLERSPEDILRVSQLRELSLLQHLDLSACSIVTNDWLESLETLPDLASLSLAHTDVTDAGLEQIARACPRLERLELDDALITGVGLVQLSSLPTLRQLTLSHTLLEDQYLDGLSALQDLTQLDVRQTALSRAGVERLRKSLIHCTIRSDHPDAG